MNSYLSLPFTNKIIQYENTGKQLLKQAEKVKTHEMPLKLDALQVLFEEKEKNKIICNVCAYIYAYECVCLWIGNQPNVIALKLSN